MFNCWPWGLGGPSLSERCKPRNNQGQPETRQKQAESSQEQSENSQRHMLYVSITYKMCFEYAIFWKRGISHKGKGNIREREICHKGKGNKS